MLAAGHVAEKREVDLLIEQERPLSPSGLTIFAGDGTVDTPTRSPKRSASATPTRYVSYDYNPEHRRMIIEPHASHIQAHPGSAAAPSRHYAGQLRGLQRTSTTGRARR